MTSGAQKMPGPGEIISLWKHFPSKRSVEKHKTNAFKGYVGIEYEGGFLRMMNPKEDYLSEDDGIKATRKLLM